MKKAIAFYSDTPGCGKTTARSFLLERDDTFVPFSFASIMDEMLRPLMDAYGVIPLNKEEPIQEIPGAPSYRLLKQTLGTEWGRKMVHSDIWVNAAEQMLKKHIARGKIPVIDDVRFANEYFMLEKLGTLFIKITRTDAPPSANPDHPSNKGLNIYPFDFILANSGDMDSYRQLILATVSPYFPCPSPHCLTNSSLQLI